MLGCALQGVCVVACSAASAAAQRTDNGVGQTGGCSHLSQLLLSVMVLRSEWP